MPIIYCTVLTFKSFVSVHGEQPPSYEQMLFLGQEYHLHQMVEQDPVIL